MPRWVNYLDGTEIFVVGGHIVLVDHHEWLEPVLDIDEKNQKGCVFVGR